MNEIIRRFIAERGLSQIGNDDLYDNPRIFDYKRDVRVTPYFTSIAITDPLTRTIPQVFDGDALKVTEQDLDGRKEGVVLVQDAFTLDAGVAAGIPFDTLGHQLIFCTLTNPAWATNPTGLTISLQVSIDAFDTTIWDVVGSDGVIIVQTVSVVDDIASAFFMPTMNNAGAFAVTNTPVAAPIPTGNAMTARLVYTPVGAAITAEAVQNTIYGITPR